MAFIGNQIITINSLLDLDGQELVLDADADSTIHVSTDDQIDFKIGGTDVATFTNSSSDFVITQAVQDKDIIFKGDDGGSAITALTLDMSEAGNASFNGTVTANAGVVVDNITIDGTEIDLSSGDLTLDVAGDIILDADGGDLIFKDGGTQIGRIRNVSSGEFTFNADVQDKDIVFNGNDGGSTITAMVIDMSEGGFVGLGTTSPSSRLNIVGDAFTKSTIRLERTGGGTDNDAGLQFKSAAGANDNTAMGGIWFQNAEDDNAYALIRARTDDGTGTSGRLDFITSESAVGNATDPRMRIKSDGAIQFGPNLTTDPVSGNVAGASLKTSQGNLQVSRDGGIALSINRKSSNGGLVGFRKDGTTMGQIDSSSTNLLIRSAGDKSGIRFDTNGLTPFKNGSESDDEIDLGFGSGRFDDLFATNGTIQTSDQNEKQDIASFTTKELNVAKKLSALFKTFRWKSKVAEKGDSARTHSGIIAQEVQSAFSSEGLDASKYGLYTSDTWWEETEKFIDGEDDNAVEKTRRVVYRTEEEATSTAIKKTRLGVRYPELFSFIFSSIEARLTALESK